MLWDCFCVRRRSSLHGVQHEFQSNIQATFSIGGASLGNAYQNVPSNCFNLVLILFFLRFDNLNIKFTVKGVSNNFFKGSKKYSKKCEFDKGGF